MITELIKKSEGGNDASLFAKDKDLFSNASDYHGRLLLNFAHETYRGAGTRTFLPVLEKRMTVENLHNMPVQNENQQQKVHRIMEAKADARHTETKANTEVSASNTNVRVTPAVDQELTRTDLPLNTEITAEELISKGETVDSEDVQKMTLDDAEKLIAEGTEALTLKDFELAANKLSLALEIQVSKLGQYAEVAASTFYLYGKALFGLSVQNTSVLGDKAEKAEVEQNAVAAYSSDEDGDEEETALEDIAVPADDLELAWENLDVARIILSKNQDSTTQVRLADVHICLGDISLENENFDQAASDFQIALDIKLQHLANKYRELAEVYFKLAISLEYAENYESAIEHIFSAKESLNKRVAELQEGEDGDTERKQIFDFLQDMDVKVSDIKAILEKEAVQELGESSRSSMPVDVKVNDVSSLVKKQKRKAEINSNDEKKVKLE